MPRIPRRPSDEARRAAYRPPGVDCGRSRRRRLDHILVLRRRNRDAGLFKRRRDEPAPAPVAAPSEPAADATATALPPPSSGPSSPPSVPPDVDAPRTAADSELDGLSEMVDKVWSDDTASQLEATVEFRKLLSDGKNSTVIKIIRADVLPRFAEFLSRHASPQLQMEAAWVLTNIAASDYTLLVAECGAVQRFVDLLGSPNANVRHQAMWALGNIAADMPSCREIVLDHGVVTPLLAQFKEDMKVSVLRTATWALSNICFGKLPVEVQVKPILEIISLLIHSADEKILADACWALYYICDGVEDGIQHVLDAGVCHQLVKLLMHASANILLPVITALARISAGDDTQVQVIVEKGILPCLTQLFARNYPKNIKKQACLIVSNITAGSKEQIQAVIDADIMNHAVALLKTAESDIKKEAAWAISNAASGGSNDQIQYLVSRGCLEPLCNVLTHYQDVDLVYACLEGLENVLKAGEIAGKEGKESAAMNPYAQFILECGGLDNLEELQDFGNDEVYKLVMKLLESYWDEEVSDDLNLPASNCDTETVETAAEEASPPSPPPPIPAPGSIKTE
ncbi:importin subunit alpha-1b isoform X1 [Brachypodium distachyon]|nr:importin subunit alpha-1b isoform X1 [Brachypodium distachyon]|eukprot:XP_003559766.1 importin subunit alpha-1b isoform X1 [Brachypodium distachyon]